MHRSWQFLGILVVAVLALYGPSVGHGFLYEDEMVLNEMPEEPGVRDYGRAFWMAAPESGWRPVWRWALMLQKGVAGAASPVPYRAVTLALVVAAGLLVFRLLRLAPMGIGQKPAFCAALLTVVHPVASANVYRLAEGQAALLALVFMVGSAAFFLQGDRVWHAAGALILYLLALGSHSQALWFPLILAVAEGVRLSRNAAARDESEVNGPVHLTVVRPEQPARIRWRRVASFLIAALACLAIRHAVMGSLAEGVTIGPRRPFLEWTYAWRVLAAPVRMTLVEAPVLSKDSAPWLLAGVGLMAAVVAAVWAALHFPDATPLARIRVELRRLAFWGAWLTAGMPAAIRLWRGGGLFDEGEALFFSVAVWSLLAWAVTRFWAWEWVRREGIVVAAAAAVTLGGVSLGRRAHYRDDATWVSHCRQLCPDAWQLEERRAAAWQAAGRPEAAARAAARSAMLKPDAPAFRRGSH